MSNYNTEAEYGPVGTDSSIDRVINESREFEQQKLEQDELERKQK